jgi:MinD superfamily P-loop ATPase
MNQDEGLYHDTVHSTWSPASLRVAESSDTRIQSETLREDILDSVRGNRIKRGVMSALSNDDNCLALAQLTMLVVLDEHRIFCINSKNYAYLMNGLA